MPIIQRVSTAANAWTLVNLGVFIVVALSETGDFRNSCVSYPGARFLFILFLQSLLHIAGINMAKSKRSKVKMAYKAMRRRVMEPANDTRLWTQAGKVYSAVGLPLPPERTPEDAMPERAHGGGVIMTSFFPTEPGPKLNCVHGPLANQDPLLQVNAPVIGLPIVGAGMSARLRSETPVHSERSSTHVMDVGDSSSLTQGVTGKSLAEERPYFYPRRTRHSSSGVPKKRSTAKQFPRHPKNKPGVQFI
jgi:hypothetical protein